MNKTAHSPRRAQDAPGDREGHEGKLVIDPQSLQHAISVRFSDIKIISIGAIPEIDDPVKE